MPTILPQLACREHSGVADRFSRTTTHRGAAVRRKNGGMNWKKEEGEPDLRHLW
jgi:hypothetical protein